MRTFFTQNEDIFVIFGLSIPSVVSSLAQVYKLCDGDFFMVLKSEEELKYYLNKDTNLLPKDFVQILKEEERLCTYSEAFGFDPLDNQKILVKICDSSCAPLFEKIFIKRQLNLIDNLDIGFHDSLFSAFSKGDVKQKLFHHIFDNSSSLDCIPKTWQLFDEKLKDDNLYKKCLNNSRELSKLVEGSGNGENYDSNEYCFVESALTSFDYDKVVSLCEKCGIEYFDGPITINVLMKDMSYMIFQMLDMIRTAIEQKERVTNVFTWQRGRLKAFAQIYKIVEIGENPVPESDTFYFEHEDKRYYILLDASFILEDTGII